MPEETGRVVAVQAEVQYQPAEIAGQCVRIGANPEGPDGPEGREGLQGPEGREGLQGPGEREEPEGRKGPEGSEGREGPGSFAVLLWCTSLPPDGADRLLVVVHGALRDAGRYLEHAKAAAREHAKAAAQEHASRTFVVAPQFLADVDLRGGAEPWPGTLYWDAEGWKGGQRALGAANLSSFTVMDRLLDQLTAPDRWPAGRPPAVVVYGNSAGGQYVNRYAAVGRGPDRLAERGIAVRFVISNLSTYLYFTDEHRWRYGFRDAPAYVEGDARANRRRYLGRDVTMVLGREDSDNASLLLETGPAAMSQGANRFERGLNYHAYIGGFGGRHRLIELDGVGHAAADVMAAGPVRELLFGE